MVVVPRPARSAVLVAVAQRLRALFPEPQQLYRYGGDEFILVMEGSIPDETNKPEGYWASFGTDANTGQPIAASLARYLDGA